MWSGFLKVRKKEEERGSEGRREEGMRIEKVYRIRKVELGQSGVVGGGTCDQRYVKSHIV